MQSLKVCRARGFTLIEVLVVLALVAFIAGFGLLMGFNSISRGSVAQERDLFLTSLLGARARALANVNESPHGVHIEDDSFVLFEGNSYPGANHRILDRDDDIIFEQLSGNVVEGVGTIVLSDGAQSVTIDINGVGRIEW